MTEFQQRLTAVLREIENHKVSKAPVHLVAVTKYQPPDRIRNAIQNGIVDLGVNYVQEGSTLRQFLAVEGGDRNIKWHFIGNIQSRKVKYLIEYDMVQSIDRLEVAEALDRHLKSIGKVLTILVEVNIGGEARKSGISVEEIDAFLASIRTCEALRVKGLMFMPPALKNIEERRPFFRQARSLYDRYSDLYGFDTLSMGTSDDFLIALEEGSNMVRLGTTLFGKRIQK